MKKLKLWSLVVLAGALLLVALQNTAPMHMRFLWLTGEAPAVLLLALTAAGGFTVGLLVGLLRSRKAATPREGH